MGNPTFTMDAFFKKEVCSSATRSFRKKALADNIKGSEDNTSKKLLESVKFRSQDSKV
jgi:hypothetical protein